MNNEPTHFLRKGKVFRSLDYMICSYQWPNQLQILRGHWQAKRYWISWDLQKPILLENNSNNRNNMKSQIKKKKFFSKKRIHFPVIWTLKIFTWRLSLDHSIKFWKDLSSRLIVKAFQKCVTFSFHYVDSDLWYWHIIWKVKTRNRGINLKNTLCTMCPSWVGISFKTCLDYRAL